jgi:hypothetical protein
MTRCRSRARLMWDPNPVTSTIARRAAMVGALIFIASVAVPAYADGGGAFLSPLVAALDTMVKLFAALGIAFGFLAAGFGILGGSENSGKWAAKAIGAAVFFVLAALGSAGALERARQFTGIQ